MRKRLCPLVLVCALLLCGCASMLERDYSSQSVHNRAPIAEGDSSILRAEDYQDLVSGVYYFVSQGMESGTIRLYNYTQDVEADLDAACLEVVQDDPLGKYAVDFIKYDCSHIVSYYEATLSITYRRTAEQIASVVSATGSSAIRAELQEALAAFRPELALRISYFTEGTDIQALLEEAYYDTPAAAFGLPQAEVNVYPDHGQQRIVEILLTYPIDVAQAAAMSQELSLQAQSLAQLSGISPGTDCVQAIADLAHGQIAYAPEGGSTAYAALVEGSADSEGVALAVQLLCQLGEVESQVVSGQLDGQPHFWNRLRMDNETRYLDACTGASLYTAEQMEQQGYLWGESLDAPEETSQEIEN